MKAIAWIVGCYLFINIGGEASILCNHSNADNKYSKIDSSSSTSTSNNKNEKADTSSGTAGSKKDLEQKIITPEMFGAIGDGKIHKLSTRYNTIEAAQKDFPGVKDLDITIDGAAFQKAIDIASKNEGEVLAEKNYAINFPLITRSNIIIDGNNKGYIFNDWSRSKKTHHIAFFFGNHFASDFDKSNNNSSGFDLYDVAGSVSAGQNFVELAKPSDVSSFKTSQLVMVVSDSKSKRPGKKIFLPYHITMSKILKIDGSKLYFEYPIDEDIPSVQVAANGNYDPHAEINFEGVENVTLRNLSVDAEQLTLSPYAYKCHIDNIKIINAINLLCINAMAHSTITNISGTFSWMGIEIKTGSSDLLVRNINATYKALPGRQAHQGKDVISLGQYCRNITIDSFNVDIGNESLKNPIIDLHARKATISNGTIICKNQTNSFLTFYNERYVDDPKFGCYANKVSNVKFYGSSSMKNVLAIGDDENDNGMSNKNKHNGSDAKSNKARIIGNNDENNNSNQPKDQEDNDPSTANVPPAANIIENCLFDGGSAVSFAKLAAGQQNIVRNCVFTKAKMKMSPAFQGKNTISNNKENN